IVQGTLMSASAGAPGVNSGLVLRLSDGRVQMVNQYSNILFPQLPEGLITKPTLVWDVEARKEGEQRAQVSYQTTGGTWWADYNIVCDEGKDANSGVLDIGAWVSIINQSGATYPDAKLKLIAGDVHRAPAARAPISELSARAAGADESLAKGFAEKAFF